MDLQSSHLNCQVVQHPCDPHNKNLGLDFPNLAYKFLTGFEFFDLNSKILHLNPIDLNFLARKFIVPASTGVMLGNLISSLANCNSL